MAQAARALRKAILEDKTPPIHNLPAGHILRYSKAIGGGAQGKAHLWVHLADNDLKPDNIFLDSPGSLGNNADRVMYPPAYLGEFGLAFTTNLGENRFGQPGGAFGWFSYTNIWQIGFTILCAMTGNTEPEQSAADQILRFYTTKWQALVDEGAFAGYSDDLLGLVHACLLCNPSDRIYPQSLLFLVETSMSNHIDNMQRWGTKSWITTKHNQTLEDDPDRPADASEEPQVGEAEDEETENETPYKDQPQTPFYPTPKSIRKRKFSGPSPAPKRLKGKTAGSHETLQRRYALIAKQMQLGKTTQSLDAHSDDKEFILANEFKVKFSRDEEFDPEMFFVGPDPGPIKYMGATQPSRKAGDNVVSTSAGAGDVSTSAPAIKIAGGKEIPYVDLE